MSGPPRLAVVGDVAPCRTQGGHLLLHRLLAEYPADRLLVVHGDSDPLYVDPARFLPGVAYRKLGHGFALPRPLRSRAFPTWRAAEQALAGRLARPVDRAVEEFRPEAVLTVVEDLLWVAAAAVARRRDVPLHMILHDDHPSKYTGNGPRPWHRLTRWLLHRGVRRAYRQAASRFCVSPGMAEACQVKYGRPATVLYPSRGDDSPRPVVRVRRDRPPGPPVVAFAGALYTEGGRELIRRLAKVLDGLGGELQLYTRNDPKQYGLDVPAARVVGFLPPQAMAERMAATADALFLPASYRQNEARDVATLFPSKLADYTAVGLPVLIWGPDYSSAGRWGRENPTAAVTITDAGRDDAEIARVLRRLAGDPDFATEVARQGLAAGARDFSPDRGRRQLRDALTGSTTTSATES